MSHKPGPGGHRDPIVEAWEMRFGLRIDHFMKECPAKICQQLSFCKDDDARRLILGVPSVE